MWPIVLTAQKRFARKDIFFHLNDPSKYIKYFPTCTIPSSPRQGLVPCLALASRFPPAGDDDDDRDHVDNGSGDDDSHDEILMLLGASTFFPTFCQAPTQISDFVAADSDD